MRNQKTKKSSKNRRRYQHTQNIFITFIVNLVFSILEFIGGSLSGSISIMSDAVRDLGDSIGIGFSYLCERKSRRPSDHRFTYGYSRFSVLGAFISTTILVAGSTLMLYLAVTRFANPVEVDPLFMMGLAIVGIIVNGLAAYRTSFNRGELNEKTANLDLLEDVAGWVIVLAGGLVIQFTGWYWLDPVMSIFVCIFVLGSAIDNYRRILNLFLEKVPDGLTVETVKFQVLAIPHVKDVHHIHLWNINETDTYATLHVVIDGTIIDGILLENSVNTPENIKAEIRRQLKASNIKHVTIELETELETCQDKKC